MTPSSLASRLPRDVRVRLDFRLIALRALDVGGRDAMLFKITDSIPHRCIDAGEEQVAPHVTPEFVCRHSLLLPIRIQHTAVGVLPPGAYGVQKGCAPDSRNAQLLRRGIHSVQELPVDGPTVGF